MKLTAEHSASFEEYMTRDVKRRILTKIREAGITISDRHINNILCGAVEDHHGVLHIAVKEISYEKVKLNNTKKILKSI